MASIDPGAPFKEVLDSALSAAAAMLVVIGPRWLTATDKQGRRRLEQPADWVRQEVAESLRRQGVRIFPLLVGGAEMPAEEDLPDTLKPLAERQAFELTVRHWANDVAQLIQILKRAGPADHRDADEESARQRVEQDKARREREERAAKKQARQKAAEEQARRKAEAEARRRSEEDARRIVAEFGRTNQVYHIGEWRHYRRESYCCFWYGNGELALEVTGSLQAWQLWEDGTEYSIIHGKKNANSTVKFTYRFWESTTGEPPAVVGQDARFEFEGFKRNLLVISVSSEAITIADNGGSRFFGF